MHPALSPPSVNLPQPVLHSHLPPSLPDSPHASQVVRGDVFQYASLPPALDGCAAVVCCTGASDPRDPLGPFNVDFQVGGGVEGAEQHGRGRGAARWAK